VREVDGASCSHHAPARRGWSIMLQKTLFKDTIREIKKTLSRFLAILAIIALGTAFFVGIKTTCPDMKLTADKYYKDLRFMDFRLISTAGFTNEDINAIKATKDIKGVMPSYSIDAVNIIDNKQRVLRISSLPIGNLSINNENYINRPELMDGRLPQKGGECVVEKSFMTKASLRLGDKMKLSSGDGSNLLDNLITDTYTIVGIIRSPMYISPDRGTTSIGNGQVSAFMQIPDTDFKLKYYSSIYITANIDSSVLAYSHQYDDKTAPLKSTLEKLSTQRAALRYEEIKTEATNAFNQKLKDSQAQINQIPAVTWHVLGRDTNIGYVDYGTAADRMDAIAQVFPIIFILVAILICFTSMSRMVEEQRMFMGTAKALGYSKASIASKFLLYAILSSIIGGSIGLAVGFTFFPPVIFKAYSILYALPKLILLFDVPFAAIAMIIGILVTSLSALIVCLGELNSNAATLMRPRAPKAGKIILLERIKFIWKRLKFTQKVTARNFFRYKSRFFMTVIGVGGCIALLLVGFGLNDAISAIGDKQYGEIYTYQMTVNLKDKIPLADTENIKNTLKQQADFSSLMSLYSKSVDIGFMDKEKSCGLVVPQNTADIYNFISLRIRSTNKKVTLADDGVVLTEKLANMLVAKTGDQIYIKNGDVDKLTVKVSGICENYLQHYMYMSPKLYEKIYKTGPSFNQIYVKLKTKDASVQENISKDIVSLNGVSSVNLMKDSMARFKDTIKSIYSIVLVLIFSAGLLSFIVLYTLTNININERMREIATIKVLGFYDKEVSTYVFRENLILTLIGTIFGLLLGYPLAKYVIGTTEVDLVMFGRQIYPLSFIISAILTLIFAWIVNIVMLRKLKKINMVEALKTVE
jgi:putative ABC transport system permease protein